MPKELNEFFNRFGTDTTNNFQLLHWGKQLGLKNFQVLMKDEIKNIDVKPLMNIICNIENSFEDGAHWSCLHVSESPQSGCLDKHFWFDSFGRPPDQEIINKFGKGTILASNFKIQDFGMRYCGQLSLFVLYKLNQGVDYQKLVLSLT